MQARWLIAGLLLAGCSAEAGKPAVRPVAASDTPAAPAGTPGDTGKREWRIDSSGSGPLGRQTSETDLRRRYGPDAVNAVRIEVGEGETAPGAVLYPGDSLRRVEIIWRDSVSRRNPARIILRGSRSRWQVPRGISLGTSLQDLERLNGRPFTLAGFGWDYAGVITDRKSVV